VATLSGVQRSDRSGVVKWYVHSRAVSDAMERGLFPAAKAMSEVTLNRTCDFQRARWPCLLREAAKLSSPTDLRAKLLPFKAEPFLSRLGFTRTSATPQQNEVH
jgi:hypothetical protein